MLFLFALLLLLLLCFVLSCVYWFAFFMLCSLLGGFHWFVVFVSLCLFMWLFVVPLHCSFVSCFCLLLGGFVRCAIPRTFRVVSLLLSRAVFFVSCCFGVWFWLILIIVYVVVVVVAVVVVPCVWSAVLVFHVAIFVFHAVGYFVVCRFVVVALFCAFLCLFVARVVSRSLLFSIYLLYPRLGLRLLVVSHRLLMCLIPFVVLLVLSFIYVCLFFFGMRSLGDSFVLSFVCYFVVIIVCLFVVFAECVAFRCVFIVSC